MTETLRTDTLIFVTQAFTTDIFVNTPDSNALKCSWILEVASKKANEAAVKPLIRSKLKLTTEALSIEACVTLELTDKASSCVCMLDVASKNANEDDNKPFN
uniref:Uncharacterized protein n=1 Tax=viral metagenome TaxID=1070528 RepID=A0A6C0CSU1_9ZZZZ